MNLLLFLTAAFNVLIQPSTVVLAPGEEASVSVQLIDDHNRPVDGFSYRLSVRPPGIARVSDDRIIGLKEGVGVIVATVRYNHRTYVGYGVVFVGGGRRLRVMVMPRRVEVAPGDTVRFNAIVRLPGYGVIEPDSIRWVVLPKSLGTIESDGLFRAGEQRGIARIVAVAEWKKLRGIGAAGVLIGRLKDKIYRVRLAPGFARILPGDTLDFTYIIENAREDGLSVQWIVDPPFMGHFEGNRFIPDVRHGRCAVFLWVEDSTGKFGVGRGVVIIGRRRKMHR